MAQSVRLLQGGLDLLITEPITINTVASSLNFGTWTRMPPGQRTVSCDIRIPFNTGVGSAVTFQCANYNDQVDPALPPLNSLPSTFPYPTLLNTANSNVIAFWNVPNGLSEWAGLIHFGQPIRPEWFRLVFINGSVASAGGTLRSYMVISGA